MKKVLTKPKSIYAVLLLGIFTFLFLGVEYLFVNMISLTASGEKTVLAQNYALGVSTVGFLLYPLFQRFLKKRVQTAGLFIFALAAAACVWVVNTHDSYLSVLISGMALFLALGLIGSAVHFLFFRLTEDRDFLARMVGISYALGILLQFINNNLINLNTSEAVILSAFALVLLALLLNAEKLCSCEPGEPGGHNEHIKHSELSKAEERPLPQKDDTKLHRKKITAGGLLILLVILMACIFSTLDNAVTMHHAAGTDIGQWPRLLLALSGLAAGFLFDIRKRKYMTLIMYCIMLMSVTCVAVLKLGGPFMIGLIVFYLSAGFFVVFFTTAFMDLACYMQAPALWTGMGRAMNNLSAALLTKGSLALLVSESNGVTAIIIALILFVAISVVIFLYSTRMPAVTGARKDIPEDLDPREAFLVMSELLALTPRETEVFDKLVNSEESIQEIADGLYLSRRTCQRHIQAIYEKAGVKSRMGLYQLYIEKQRRL